MISEVYKNRILYFNMMKEFLQNKISILDFQNKYFNQGENSGYPSGNTEDLKRKLNNKEIFDIKNEKIKCDLEDQINALEFSRKYWSQRDKDLDKNKANGYRDYYLNKTLLGNDRLFEEQYKESLQEKGVSFLKEYEEGAKKLSIEGEMFFMGMWYFIDNYVREYTPSDAAYFNSETDIDEQTLTKTIKAVVDVLERNKERWEYSEINDDSIKM